MKTFVLIVSMLFTVAFTANDAISQDRETMKKQITKCLDVMLVDPDSAKVKFGPFFKKNNGEDGGMVCVLVNSKNKYGGYTGYQHGFFFVENGEISCKTSSFDQRLRRVIGKCENVEYE